MTERLPIYDVEQELVEQARAGRRLLVRAPTGSGKSTQVPQMLLRHGLLDRGQVVVLQPRRLAARLLAARVARELGVELGQEVGYQVRLDNVTSGRTRIRYVTEGILLRQLIEDPALSGVQAVIFDEFHERHLYGDITLARALDLQESQRPDLRILVMSATLPTRLLSQYLQPCHLLSSEGRTFPVDIEHLPIRGGRDAAPIWEQAAEAFARRADRAEGGDVLVFMPGGFEIQQTIEALRRTPEAKGYLLLPLHGELAPGEQDAAVARYDRPKVVVATNVAETSLTIDGVRLVIDSGLARIPRYDPHRGINTLWIEPISQASADQRAGRAGRTAPGYCVRLWSERDHQDRPRHELSEVQRLDLSEVVLTLKAAGLSDLARFRWLEPPSEKGLQDAEELLRDLGALGDGGGITPLGRKMLAFPVHPRYARLLLAAQDYGCVRQAALIAALTQGRDLLVRSAGREATERRRELFGEQATSDFWIQMRAWQYAQRQQFRTEACRQVGVHALTARQVGPLFDQFLRIAEREGLDVTARPTSDEAIQKCILVAFCDRVGRRMDQGTLRCELVHGRRGNLVRESVVQHAEFLVAAEIREVEGPERTGNTLLSLATAIEPGWLAELFPGDVARDERVEFDPVAKRVVAEAGVRFHDLRVSSRRLDTPPLEAAARLLAEEVLRGRLVLKHWDHGIEQWIVRLNSLCAWCPELALPPIREEDRRHLVEQICHGAVSQKDIKDRPVRPVVEAWLSAAQKELLEQHAPERLRLSNGRTPRLTYPADGEPFVALRIQELFGVTTTPRIAQGRVPVLFHILAPNMRPVQITQDLAGFWREHYPRVKQELQRRYPKHEWR